MNCRQNFSTKCEDLINEQINMELSASYAYLQMASYFGRSDVDLPNVTQYFYTASTEEQEHAKFFIDYMNKRGGDIKFSKIKESAHYQYTLLGAFSEALELEKKVNQSLLDLHKAAEDENDPQLADMLEGHFLGEQVDAIREISGHITNINRCLKSHGEGLGEYMFDKHFLGQK